MIRNAIYDGAEAFMIHLEKLADCYINVDDLKRIFNYVGDRQIISVNYRSVHKPNKSDDEIVKEQLIATKAGANIVDIVGDIYSPSKNELAIDEKTIKRQKELIEQFHQNNVKVMLSSHTFCFLNKEDTLKHCLSLQNRGADLVKIAVTAGSEEELLEVNKTTIELKKMLSVPYFHCCMGQYGKLHRIYSAFLGSSIILCVQNYNENSNPKEQPLLRNTKVVLDNLDFTIAKNDLTGTIRNV